MSKSRCAGSWIGVAYVMVAMGVVGAADGQVLSPVGTRMVVVGRSVELPIDREVLDIQIDGQHATTKVSQVFVNGEPVNVEGQYTLTAGPGTRANGFAYWNGEEKIVGEVFEKEVARAVYTRVTRQRRDPGLLEEKADGVFSFLVSPIQPNEHKRVEVTYSQWLPRRAGVVEVTAPVSRADAEVTVVIQDGRPIRDVVSPTHEIEIKQLQGKVLVRGKGARGPGGVFSLRYTVAVPAFAVSAFVHKDKGQDAFFAVTMGAPWSKEAVLPKDMTLVIDRSGSMDGEKLTQAREACLNILRRLGPDDRANVILFDHKVDPLWKAPKPVTDDNRRQAMDFVELMQLGGGTDLDLALKAALNSQLPGKRPRVILFFTDGMSNPDRALAAAAEDKNDVRVFTVGLGRDVNRALLSRLASDKRGRFTFIPAASDIERQVSVLYQQIADPVLVDLALSAKGGKLFATYPRPISDLFNGDEILVTGRLRGTGTVELILAAKEKDKDVEFRTEVSLDSLPRRPWVGRLWAKSRIDDLLDEIRLNRDPNGELKNEVTELGLAYNFVTPYTSFLAIPAAEVDLASGAEIESARMRKQQIRSKRAGSADLGAPETAEGYSAQKSQVISAPVRPMQDREVQPLASDISEESTRAVPMERSAHVEPERGPRKGGCASCALGDRGGNAAFGLLVLFGVFAVARLRRRR